MATADSQGRPSGAVQTTSRIVRAFRVGRGMSRGARIGAGVMTLVSGAAGWGVYQYSNNLESNPASESVAMQTVDREPARLIGVDGGAPPARLAGTIDNGGPPTWNNGDQPAAQAPWGRDNSAVGQEASRLPIANSDRVGVGESGPASPWSRSAATNSPPVENPFASKSAPVEDPSLAKPDGNVRPMPSGVTGVPVDNSLSGGNALRPSNDHGANSGITGTERTFGTERNSSSASNGPDRSSKTGGLKESPDKLAQATKPKKEMIGNGVRKGNGNPCVPLVACIPCPNPCFDPCAPFRSSTSNSATSPGKGSPARNSPSGSTPDSPSPNQDVPPPRSASGRGSGRLSSTEADRPKLDRPTLRHATYEGPVPTLAEIPPGGKPVVLSWSETYSVMPQDSYWTIAETLYGSGEYFRALSEHNRRKQKPGTRLRPGDEIFTPELTVLRRTYPQLCPRD